MYKVLNRTGDVFGDEPDVCDFLCDTSDDIATLPNSTAEGTGGKSKYDNQKCASGSVAYISAETENKIYILNNNNVWEPQ